ncbi:M57 family metalloprotease [Aquimarina latercula]|uniref:M57 family metalloprotease n=1 Tax=Aquimarina latercula TaxID=987 RepID=UPI0003FD801F|nr:M57 family metalloprotease [Aquimarina latercula]
MKNLQLGFPTFTLALVAASSLFFSCENEDLNPELQESKTFTKQEQANLTKIGFDQEKTKKNVLSYPDGTSEEFYVYNDLTYAVANIGNLDNLESDSNSEDGNEKLFRTTNLAARNRQYTIAFFDMNAQYQRQAIGDAIWQFNNTLDTSITLRAVFANGADFGNTQRDIAVFWDNTIGNFYALAEFPANNRPGRTIRVNWTPSILADFDDRANFRELIMHEVGHQFGLRHSDWRANGEPVSELGAIHIPGTDNTGRSQNSIMVATAPLAGRWFTNQDIVAMRALYGFVPR